MAAARTPGSGAAAPGPQKPSAAARRHPAQRGFTLVELLVALALMALMAAMSWRGLDAMAGAQKRLAQHSDGLLTLQTGLAQWGADLDALALQPNIPSIDWDGRALRLLRRGSQSAGEGLHVVAWSQRLVDHARRAAGRLESGRALGPKPQRRRPPLRGAHYPAGGLADIFLPGWRLDQPLVLSRRQRTW